MVLLLVAGAIPQTFAQGNKLSITGTGPKNMSICGFNDTANFTIYNISSSNITSIKVTLTLPSGIFYVAGSVKGTGISESNITNLNKPVFSCPNLFLAQNFSLRVTLTANCDLVPLLSGSYTPDIGIRADYSGNYDVGTSQPFVPLIPSPGFASISNLSYTGNVGDKFIRKISITNYGKGPLNAVRLMLINGSDLKGKAQTGFTTTISGDTIRTFFDKNDIKKIGDGDTLFELNETLVITDTFTINACNRITTYFEIGWGCGGKICQVIKNNGSVTISSDNPVLQTWVSWTDKLCYDGTTPQTQFITVTNTGKKPAKLTRFNIYSPYGASNCRIDTNTVWVKKGIKGTLSKVHPDSCYQPYYVASCMPSFSITYMQVPLGTINPGDTFYLSWDMYRCAESYCGFAFYDLGWVYNYNYRNQCNSLNVVTDQWGKTYGGGWGSVSLWAPSDIARDETKEFKFTFTSWNNVTLDKTGQIRVDFILPKTLTHSLSKSDLYITNNSLTSTWYPDSIAWRKDTLRAFYGNAFPFSLLNGELSIKLKGICTQYAGNASLPVSMKLYYNPQPSCNPYIWINPVCATFNIKVHCSNSCNGGMQFKNFEAYRSSYGKPDNDNDGIADKTGSLDLAKIRRERAMYGDTITTVFIGRPKNATGINNWKYGYAESYVNYGYYLDVVDAKLVVYKGTTLQTGNCNQVRVKKVVAGFGATFKFDFSIDSIWTKGCIAQTYKFTGNDSIRLVVRYRVSGNISAQGLLMTFSNRYYLGSAANPTASQSYQCDTFSANMMLYGYYLYNCCGDNILYSNCAEVGINQSWYTAIGAWNYAGNNMFPYEYRPWTKMKALHIYLPPGLKMVTNYWGQYRTNGIGTYQWEHKDSLKPRTGTSNPVVFDFDRTYKDSGGIINVSDDGVQGYFTYTVQPRCNLPVNKPIRIDYDYIFERQGVWGKGYDTISTKVYGGYDNFTFVPPTLSLTPVIPTVYATKDTVDWIVSFTNPSSTFSAYNVWLSPRSNANIKVVEVRDYDKDTVIKPSKDIYRAGLLSSSKIRRFKIRAVFNSCSPDSLQLYGSYDCADYPADFASYPCTPVKTTLFLEPQNTRLQLTLTDSTSKTDLCATNKMTLLVENIQSVTAYNTKIRVSLPIGMHVVSGSAKLKYPIGSSAVSLGQPVLVSGTIYEWDLGAKSTAVATGFSGTGDTSKNKMLITFRVSTDCDYASGSILSARAVSNIRCGDPVPAAAAFSNPLDINGVTRPYYTLVKTWADTLLPCEKPMIVKTRVIFLGPGKSGTKDKVEIFLPNGMSRDTSYWKAIRNAPPKDSLTITNINGAALLSWKCPANIIPGDSLEFDIRVDGYGPSLNCGTAEVLTRSVVVQPVVCVTTGTACDIKVITGSEIAPTWVDKGSLDLTNLSISTKLLSADTEQISLSYAVKNTGRNTSATNALKVKYYYDANNNGKWDLTDKYLGVDSVKKALSTGTSTSISKTLNVTAGYSCAILAVIDSGACSCKFGQRRFGAPSLANAGNDTTICDKSPLLLGGPFVKSWYYFWNNYQLLDDVLKANPRYTSTNQSQQPDTNEFVLTTNRGFCISRDTMRLIVNPLPKVLLTLHDTNLCAKQPVLLGASVTAGSGSYTYLWKPSTGVKNPVAASTLILPLSNTNYKLFATDSRGCTGNDSVRITANPFPKGWFTWPATCAGNDPVITDSSSISSGSIAERRWQMPWGDTLNATKLKVPMYGNQLQRITLITKSAIGCYDTVSRLVDVKAIPNASFSSAGVCLGDSTHFSPVVTIDSGTISTWNWNFGDAGSGTVKNAVHLYKSSGSFNTSLVVSSNYGCRDTATAKALVFAKPKAAFTVKNRCEKDSLRFVNTSNLFGDTLNTFNWQIGATASTMTNPVVYAKAFGVVKAFLQVSTVHGCTDTITAYPIVYPLPLVSYTDTNQCLNKISPFTNTSGIPQGNISQFVWKFGDGSTTTALSPFHQFNQPGTYKNTLIAISNYGCRDSFTDSLIVYPMAYPSFTAPPVCFPNSIAAAGKIRGGGVPANWKWHSGTGDSSSGQNFTYKYSQAGSYQLKLTVVTDKGCLADTMAMADVNPLPVVSVSANSPCNDDSAVFSGNASISKGFVATWTWYFSDGSTATGKRAEKRFNPPGYYSGRLVAVTDKGCVDSASVSVQLHAPVVPAFTSNTVCLDETTVFTNTSYSAEPVTSYYWNFGDGRNSTLQNPTHTYGKDGSWPVTLTFETLPGCKYTISNPVIVHPKPVSAFSTNPPVASTVNPNITFGDISSGADSIWFVSSDGFKTSLRNFTHSFPDSGNFVIWQFASNKYGCKDSSSASISVNFMYTLYVPQAFTPNNDTHNELFGPGGMGISNYTMRIYNRWGGLVFETEESKPWDGTYMGQPVPIGQYIVLIDIRDFKRKAHHYQGTVTIIR